MTLRQKQSKFLRMVADLIIFAYDNGYELTGGDLYRDPRCPYGSEVSQHKKRLAIDLNLFRNGRWLAQTIEHKELGEYWESKGGTWGGRWDEDPVGAGNGRDGNHYQID